MNCTPQHGSLHSHRRANTGYAFSLRFLRCGPAGAPRACRRPPKGGRLRQLAALTLFTSTAVQRRSSAAANARRPSGRARMARPNWAFNRTANGVSPWPRGSVVHHLPRGQGATPSSAG
jgi:hypothetical protein